MKHILELERENRYLKEEIKTKSDGTQRVIDLWMKESLARARAESQIRKLKMDIYEIIDAPFNKIKSQ